jgi:hypothetical protein
MKKTATIFVVMLFVLTAVSGFAAQEVVTKALKPVPKNPKQFSIPFNAPQKYVKLGAKNAPLAATEELSYFDPDIANNFIYMRLPDYFDEPSGSVTVFAYGERFTSQTLTNFTVDSFQVTIGSQNFEDRTGNRLLFTLRRKGSFPGNPNIFPAFTYVDTAQVFPADLPPADNAYTITVPFAKKTKPKFTTANPDFWIFAELPDTVGNNLLVLADATTDDPANHQSPLPDGDRSYDYYVRNDTTFVSYLGGTYVNTQTQEVYYNQLAITAYISGTSLGVDDAKLEGNSLAQNYPNPFNPSTEIKYSLANTGKATLKVYNALGIEVATLFDGTQSAGEHTVTFNGDGMPTGTYFYTLQSGTFTQTKRMVLTK